METVIDHISGKEIIRPVPEATLRYDFDFRKVGDTTWRYLNSSDRLGKFATQIGLTLQKEGEYRIIECKTGKIISSNV